MDNTLSSDIKENFGIYLIYTSVTAFVTLLIIGVIIIGLYIKERVKKKIKNKFL